MKRLAALCLTAAVLVASALWAIGPDWRRALRNPPLDRDVLAWSVAERDAGFRLLDRVPLIARAAWIEPSSTPRPLPKGTPLPLEIDLSAAMARQRIAGLVVLDDGEVRIEEYGLRFGPDRRWTSFSVAKSLTSSLVGAALKDGYIASLDDPVTSYLPALEGSPYAAVTVEDLLTMRSGVAWNEDYEDPGSDVARYDLHEAPEGMPQTVSYLRTLTREAPPGERWLYSTGETNLIGVLVAQATGRSLAAYQSEKIWQPYGMADRASWIEGRDGYEMGGCCIQATTKDFARYGLFVLDTLRGEGPGTVPRDYLAAATSWQTSTSRPGRPGYGYQWWINEDGSFQASGIFGQGIFIDPELDLVIASNANWRSAMGERDGEAADRDQLYEAIRNAVRRERTGP